MANGKTKSDAEANESSLKAPTIDLDGEETNLNHEQEPQDVGEVELQNALVPRDQSYFGHDHDEEEVRHVDSLQTSVAEMHSFLEKQSQMMEHLTEGTFGPMQQFVDKELVRRVNDFKQMYALIVANLQEIEKMIPEIEQNENVLMEVRSIFQHIS